MIGGGAFLAAAMQGPLSGVVLVLELTRNFDALIAPTLLAVAEATVIARRLGAPSIYSARLRPAPERPGASTLVQEALAALDRPDAIGDEELDAGPDAGGGAGPGEAGPGEGAAGELGTAATGSLDATPSDGRAGPPAAEPPRGRRARSRR